MDDNNHRPMVSLLIENQRRDRDEALNRHSKAYNIMVMMKIMLMTIMMMIMMMIIILSKDIESPLQATSKAQLEKSGILGTLLPPFFSSFGQNSEKYSKFRKMLSKSGKIQTFHSMVIVSLKTNVNLLFCRCCNISRQHLPSVEFNDKMHYM